MFDDRKHDLVQTSRRDASATVLIDGLSRLEDLENALLREGRNEEDGEIGERRHTLPDGAFVGFDRRGGLIFDQVPFVDADDQPLLVFPDDGENIEVLTFDAPRGVEHEQTNVRVFYRADRTDDGVILEVLVHLALFADARRVDEVKVEAELVVPCVDGVAGGARDVGHDVAFLSDEGIDE